MHPAGRQVALRGMAVRTRETVQFSCGLLSMDITQKTVEKIAVLHDRFSVPKSCRTTEGLAQALRQRNENLDEMQAAGSAPSQATVASTLKAISGKISELKNTIEIAAIMAPGNVRTLHQVVSKSANRRSVLGCDPQTQDPKLARGSGLCKFHQKGRRKFGRSFKMHRQGMKKHEKRGQKKAQER